MGLSENVTPFPRPRNIRLLFARSRARRSAVPHLAHRHALRRSLRANVIEGAGAEIFNACATSAVVTGWAIHLGGDPVYVGALSAIPIASQIVHLPAAWITDRGVRRKLAAYAVGGSRVVFAPLAM